MFERGGREDQRLLYGVDRFGGDQVREAFVGALRDYELSRGVRTTWNALQYSL
jgi:hypothetical protein